MSAGISAINDEVQRASAFVQPLFTELNKVIIGQRYLLERLVHRLARERPCPSGRAFPAWRRRSRSKSLGGLIERKILTPAVHAGYAAGGRDRDADLQSRNPAISARRGPIFANLVLADEINRAPAKVQSALLEAMQEKQVTIGEQTFRLEEPFLVLATQNPIEQEGTYPLPEAQVDRFMLKLKIVYPSRQEERQILDLMARTKNLPAGASGG
jgi:MoxR-like ATPase